MELYFVVSDQNFLDTMRIKMRTKTMAEASDKINNNKIRERNKY